MFQGACSSLGLLSDDKEFRLREVVILASGLYLRRLFVTLLVANCIVAHHMYGKKHELLADENFMIDEKSCNIQVQSITFVQAGGHFINVASSGIALLLICREEELLIQNLLFHWY